MMDNFDFSNLERASRPVVGPDGKKYVLKEASGEAGRLYKNTLSGAGRFNAAGRPDRLEGLADAEYLLVEKCLFELKDFGNGDVREAPITRLQIQSWPDRAIDSMAKWVKKVSRLESELTADQIRAKIVELQSQLEEEEAEKKQSNSTPDGCDSPPASG